jgi:hypothetical protein
MSTDRILYDAATQNHNAALAARIAAAGLDWIVPDWPVPSHVLALSTTRSHGARSGSPPAPHVRPELDTGAAGAAAAVRTQASLALAPFVPAPPIWLSQVHGANVAILDVDGIDAARASSPVADAAVTRVHGVVCAVRTADCLPVLFADRTGIAVGAAHAGWRGLAAGVLEATVAALTTLGARPHDLVAWLGPAIGPTAFEVGRDVHGAFTAGDPDCRDCFAAHAEGKWLADLYGLARRRLSAAGVHDVHGGGWCTAGNPARFYSYRRARDTARMASLVWLAPDRGGARI